MRVAAVLVLIALFPACDSRTVKCPVMMGPHFVIDDKTGLMYDPVEAGSRRQQYREMLIAQGREMPIGVGILSPEQRQELSVWRAERYAKNAAEDAKCRAEEIRRGNDPSDAFLECLKKGTR